MALLELDLIGWTQVFPSWSMELGVFPTMSMAPKVGWLQVPNSSALHWHPG